ncbi:MAG TPA: hypothetical protein PK443_01100 [bacterium]|nr:hypothetical protein [bacterium]
MSLLITILIFSSLYSQDSCLKMEEYYILGNYKACVAHKQESLSQRCRYIKALCSMANEDNDTARYEFSLIGVELKNGEAMNEINGLALTSMVEAQFLKGEYSKARNLSQEMNALLSRKMPYSYPYFVSELLMTRSYFNSFDTLSAKKRLALAKTAGMEALLSETFE